MLSTEIKNGKRRGYENETGLSVCQNQIKKPALISLLKISQLPSTRVKMKDAISDFLKTPLMPEPDVEK